MSASAHHMETAALSPRTPSTIADGSSPSAHTSVEKRRDIVSSNHGATVVNDKLHGVTNVSNVSNVSDVSDGSGGAKEDVAKAKEANEQMDGNAVVTIAQSEPTKDNVDSESEKSKNSEKKTTAVELDKVDQCEAEPSVTEKQTGEKTKDADGSSPRHANNASTQIVATSGAALKDSTLNDAISQESAQATTSTASYTVAKVTKAPPLAATNEQSSVQPQQPVKSKQKPSADSPELIVGADGKKRKLVKKEPKAKPTVFENKPAPSSAHTGALRSSPATANQTKTVFENSPNRTSTAHASTLRPAETKASTKTVFESSVVPTKADAGTYVAPKTTTAAAPTSKTVFENVPKPSAATAAAVVAARPTPQAKSIYETVPAPSKAHASWREQKAPIGDGKVEFTNIPQPRAGVMRWDSALPAVAQNQVVFESQPAPTKAHASALRPRKDVDAGSEYSYETVSDDDGNEDDVKH